jgi:hypothetical protein
MLLEDPSLKAYTDPETSQTILKGAAGFSWRDINQVHPGIFPEDVRKRLDSYFKLKAFW